MVPGEDVGHVSLGIGKDEETYVSFWPTDAGKATASGLFNPIGFENKVDYLADLSAEGRMPEFTIKLYSLHSVAMVLCFNEEIKKTKGWALMGANVLLNRSSGHSCASMAYTVLKAGGIYELIPSRYSSTVSSAPSPDALLNVVMQAKRTELEKYPETQSFNNAGCTAVPESNSKIGLVCRLMEIIMSREDLQRDDDLWEAQKGHKRIAPLNLDAA